MTLRRMAPAVATALALAGCGAVVDHASPHPATSSAPRTAVSGSPAASGSARPVSDTTSTRAIDELSAAEQPHQGQFPVVRSRTLEQVATAAKSTARLTAATGTYALGTTRYAFGLNLTGGGFIYAPSAVYLATSPGAPASGPYLAPADPLAVAPPYRSAQNDPDAVKAVYDADVRLPHPGVYAVLVLTKTAHGLIGSSSEIAVAASSPIPGVGQRPPAIATDTLNSVHGNLALLTTRQPPEDMHSVSFNQVLGKRPIALLISTPALCVSRVCGPVTDIMVELQHEFGDRIEFIHEEVYVDDDPSKGLRPQLKAFHIQTEPWLFTVNARGIISARINGAFGVNEARAALQAALK
jgi:hypothetical protein